VLGLVRGRLVHANINKSESIKHERAVGWFFHYFTGAALALTYPAVVLAFGGAMPGNHLLTGFVWGLATVLLPWFVLFPGFGWGLFGTRSPQNVRSVLAPLVEHSIYGLGVGIVLTITA